MTQAQAASLVISAVIVGLVIAVGLLIVALASALGALTYWRRIALRRGRRLVEIGMIGRGLRDDLMARDAEVARARRATQAHDPYWRQLTGRAPRRPR